MDSVFTKFHFFPCRWRIFKDLSIMAALRLYLCKLHCNCLVTDFKKSPPLLQQSVWYMLVSSVREEVSCPPQFQTEGLGRDPLKASVSEVKSTDSHTSSLPGAGLLYLKDYGSQKPIKVSDSSAASATACREEIQCEKGEIMCSLTNGHPTRHRLIFHIMSSVRFE